MPATSTAARIPIRDAVLALAFVGDLSMGRPTDHSRRTAWLAARLAQEDGGRAHDGRTAHDIALLRWSGCTANAEGFDRLLGDDVAGREQLMAMTLPLDAARVAGIWPLARIHCEVSGDIASQLGMDADVETGLRLVFETWDGRGHPGQRSGDAVPAAVYCVALASDFEILSRARGLAPALEAIASLADAKYPARLVARLAQHASDWLAELDANPDGPAATPPASSAHDVPLELIADVADLKLPWLAGHSRRVADCARATGAVLGLDTNAQALLQRAGLIHAMGRAAVANHVWQRPGRLTGSDWERVRLMPYWTGRAASLIPGLKAEAELASHAFERLDGAGYYRNVGGPSLSPSHRVLSTAVALVALRSQRPWRPAHDATAAATALRGEAASGRFDRDVTEAALAALDGATRRAPPKAAATLSQRETDVLRRISLGESNKEVARALELSPSTVRTHIESVFRKLECSTRAAATLKAFTLGLL